MTLPILNRFTLAVLSIIASSASSLAGEFIQPDSLKHPGLFVWTDTCNVWVLREGDSAVLINLGDGSILEHLDQIGVRSIDWILFTDHHREQCQGAPKLGLAKLGKEEIDAANVSDSRFGDIKIAAPEAERDLFQTPMNFRKMKVSLGDAFTIHGASYVRPPIQPIRIDQGLLPGQTLNWKNRHIDCIDSQGTSPGGMTYRLVDGGKKFYFTGDLMLDGAKMHVWFDTEWDYGFAAGIHALQKSVGQMIQESPDWMLPSHGPLVRDPKAQLLAYQEKLNKVEALYVRGYGVEAASNAYQDKVSTPTMIPDLHQVSPHLFKFKRKNFWPNFSLILADSGRALLADCGLLDQQMLEQTIIAMREHYGLKSIDAVIVSHMHGDHFLEATFAREKWGTQVWALDRMVDKMEHPERFDYSAPIQAYGKKGADGSSISGVRVDRAFRSGESFDWEGYHFTIDWMPGQTEFALCLQGEIDGRLVAFTGDNIFGDPDDVTQTGHEAVVAHNSSILEEGYIYGSEYLTKLKPDLLMGGHSFVMDRPSEFIERYRKWSYQMRDALKDLSSQADYRYWYDPFWVRAEPYRAFVKAGQSTEIELEIRNFQPEVQAHRIRIHTPPGLTAQPDFLEGELPPESRRTFSLSISASSEASSGVNIIGLDVTRDGKRFGELFDAVIEVQP